MVYRNDISVLRLSHFTELWKWWFWQFLPFFAKFQVFKALWNDLGAKRRYHFYIPWATIYLNFKSLEPILDFDFQELKRTKIWPKTSTVHGLDLHILKYIPQVTEPSFSPCCSLPELVLAACGAPRPTAQHAHVRPGPWLLRPTKYCFSIWRDVGTAHQCQVSRFLQHDCLFAYHWYILLPA